MSNQENPLEGNRILYYVLLPGSGKEEGRLFPLSNASHLNKEGMVEQRREFLGDQNLEGVYCAAVSESVVKRENAMPEGEGGHSYDVSVQAVLPNGELGPQESRKVTLVPGTTLPLFPAEEYILSGGE